MTKNVNDMKTYFEHFKLYLQTYNKSQNLAQIIKILKGYPPNTKLCIDKFMVSHIIHIFSDVNGIFFVKRLFVSQLFLQICNLFFMNVVILCIFKSDGKQFTFLKINELKNIDYLISDVLIEA